MIETEISTKGLELAAQVVSTIFSAVFAITAIVLQINGYPLSVIIRRLKSDLTIHLAFGITFLSLAVQIIAVNSDSRHFKASMVRANPFLVIAQLSSLIFLIYKMIQYLETRAMARSLGRELLEVEQ